MLIDKLAPSVDACGYCRRRARSGAIQVGVSTT
jgi:hypothetical protein